MDKRGMSIIIVIMLLTFVYALSFNDLIESDFSGSFNSTFYNSSEGYIQVGNTTLEDSDPEEMTGGESGLISYWRMNESSWSGSSGEVKDVLGANNGTSVNGATTTSGLFGNAGSFDGVENYVQVSSSSELNPGTNSFTITGWARSSERGGSNQWHLYVTKRGSSALNGYYLGLYEGNGLNFMIGDSSNNRRDTGNPTYGGNGYVLVNYDEWFHFAAVVDRSINYSILYVNGVNSANTTISSVGIISNTANLSLGYDEGQNAYPVTGNVDEIALWNKALNLSEILELYQKGNVSSQSQPTSGTYESEVKDAGAIVNWTNISWNGLIGGGLGELPDNQGVDSGANMSGNVLLMHMNEASGAIFDFSGEGNNGSQNGGVTYDSNGKYNTALSFDGSDDYISIPHDSNLNLGNTLTLEAWVYPTSLSDRYTIYSTRRNNPAGSFQLEIGPGNSHTNIVAVAGYNTWVVESENNTVTLNEWNHLVYTRNGTGTGNHKVYVNGQEKTLQTTSAYDFVDNSDIKMIGAGTSLLAMHYFPGIIDEVAVYNRVLSSEEVLDHYNRNGTSSGIKFQLKTSNDNSSWTDYIGTDGTSSSFYNSPQTLNLSNSRYLQYKAYFQNTAAYLYNATINYETIGDLVVSLDSPVDNYLTNSFSISANCSASSNSTLVNATLYHDFSGSWGPHETKSVSGTSNSTSFSFVDVTIGTHLWNCYFCNSNGTCSFANSNKTIIVDNLAPTVNLISPEEGYNEGSSQTINFVFNATDERATNLDCSLLVNGSEVASNSSVISGANTTISSSISNGNYTWYINCSDSVNYKISEVRNLTINTSSSYTPFWAKANTHTHTTNSDGDSSPSTVIGLYKNLDYNVLAITDHGFVTDCSSSTNLSGNFICVNSEEWTSTKHVTRINVSTAYNNAAQYLQDAVNAANNEGGFSIAAHPNWSSTIWTVSQLTSLENYTAMEIYNKVIERLSPDPYAVDKWDEVLVTGKKIFGVAADDMHQIANDLGYGFTKVYMPEFTKQAYIDSMKIGYFYSSQGPNMDEQPFELECDGLQTYHMGETANCSAISVNAIVSATNSSYSMANISLIKDGVVINVTTCSSQNCTCDYSENVSSSGYYRLQARDNYNKWVWSNPIWVNKIALPVSITVNSPLNGSTILDYTPLLNITLSQETSLWYSLNNRNNLTLCTTCSSSESYLTLIEGSNLIKIYSNNSDNIIYSETINITLNFNKSNSESFIDNSSIESTSNVFLNNGKMSLGVGEMFGNFILKPIQTSSNITSFTIHWTENNTEGAEGEGQRDPIILKYKLNNFNWIDIDSLGSYIINGTEISGLNGNNFSIMFDFEKNNETPIDLLSFNITWTEFTVPLISNVAESTTSSGATITWDTDVASNSTVEYGNSVLLGTIFSDSDLVTSHLMILLGLTQNTVYYYKIKSCTVDSCAEYPQSPYPVDSFTTQTVSSSSSSSSGSSGGGGGSSGGAIVTTPAIISGLNKLELNKISVPNFKVGETKNLILKVRNAGTNFLNGCKLALEGSYKNLFRISGSSSKNIAAGEEYGFTFDLSTAKEMDPGKYDLSLFVNCIEANSSTNVVVDIIEEKIKFELINVDREGEDQVKIIYSLEELSGVDQDVELQFLLFDSNNNKISEITDTKALSSGSKQEHEILMLINPSLSGELSLLVNINSETYSSFVEEDVILGPLITGLAIFDDLGGTNGVISGVIVLVFLVFAFFMIRRILKHRKRIKKSRKMHTLWLEY
ncbi:MAG: LamG-like jellyroll fold domain-containing protein [archaeon]